MTRLHKPLFRLSLISILVAFANTSFASPLPHKTPNVTDIQFAAGSYNTSSSGATRRPFILGGTNNGKSWSYVQNINGLPTDLTLANLFSISCAGNLCAAIGDANSGNMPMPFVLNSYDKGQSWSLANISVPDYAMPTFSSVSCSAKFCVVTGFYFEFNLNMQSLLLVNNEKDKTWTKIQNISGYPGDIRYQLFSSVSCKDNFCALAGLGNSTDGDESTPVVVTSNDSGQSWKMVNTISGLPAMSKSELQTISCTDGSCIAAGKYVQGNSILPLLLVSKDQQSWSFVPKISGFPSDVSLIQFNSINCTGNFCTVVGSYLKGNNNTMPLLLTSIDHGQSWSTEKMFSGFIEGTLSTGSCKNATCVVGGFYSTSEKINSPLLVTTHDMGNSWSIVQNISGLPADTNFAAINAVNCGQTFCSAAGVFSKGMPSTPQQPLLLVSDVNAQNWSYLPDISGLPTDFYQGEIRGLAH